MFLSNRINIPMEYVFSYEDVKPKLFRYIALFDE